MGSLILSGFLLLSGSARMLARALSASAAASQAFQLDQLQSGKACRQEFE
jgi:hypothetical protein